MSEELGGQALDDRAEQQGGEEGERARRSRSRRSAARRRSACRCGTCPAPSGRDALRGQRAGHRERRQQRHEAADQHRDAAEQVGERDPEGAGVAGRVRLHEAGVAGERGAVVVAPARCRRRASRRSPAGPELKIDGAPYLVAIASAVATSTTSGTNSVPISDELHLARLDLLAEVLGRAARPSGPAMKTASRTIQQHPVEARADAAEDHLAGHHVDQRHAGRRCRCRSRARS